MLVSFPYSLFVWKTSLPSALDPVSPSKHQVRARESIRSKPFPAGNAVTSTSRTTFLRSLCNLSEFFLLVNLIQPMVGRSLSKLFCLIQWLEFQPRASVIPKNYPGWASWSRRETHLPAEFHSSKSFQQVLSILKKALTGSSVVDGGKIDSPLLLLGLAYQEVSRAMDMEPGVPSNTPDCLVKSPFGVGELNKITSLLKSICPPQEPWFCTIYIFLSLS